MSKKLKFVFEREDGQTLETNAIDIPCNVVDIGTFNSEEEIIQYVIMNQLPTGLYKTGLNTENSSFIFSLVDDGFFYCAVLIAPSALNYVIATKQGQVLNFVRIYYDDIATKDEIPDVINNLYSSSTSAALSANQGRVIGEKLVDLDNRSRLIWQGNLTLYPGTGEIIEEALMSELFQEPGLFALTFQTLPPIPYDGGPFSITVLIDTGFFGYMGYSNFSSAGYGSYQYGFESGVLLWGIISFQNEYGYVEFINGYFYDFGELELTGSLIPYNLDRIELLTIHRITSATD